MSQPVARDVKAAEIAARLVSARLDARALEAYPGIQPVTLGQGYLIQEVAIHLWPDEIAGWKIGLVPLPLRERLGSDRVAGPIWSRAVWKAEGEVEFPVFEGGFAAVEAEFVFRMKADAPAGLLQDQLTLVTNDQRMPTVVLPVEGRVTPPLTVSPSPLLFGTLAPGQSITKQLVISGKQPFKVLPHE